MTAENTAAHIAHEMERRRIAEERVKQLESENETWRERWLQEHAKLRAVQEHVAMLLGELVEALAGAIDLTDEEREEDGLPPRTADEPTGFRDWTVTEEPQA